MKPRGSKMKPRGAKIGKMGAWGGHGGSGDLILINTKNPGICWGFDLPPGMLALQERRQPVARPPEISNAGNQ